MMKLSLAALVSVSLLAALAPAARADDANPAIATASTWFAKMLEGYNAPPPLPTKKAPIAYAIHSSQSQCRKVKVGKATSAKVVEKLSTCTFYAYWHLVGAESGDDPTPGTWTVATENGEAAFNKKQKKAILAAAKGATVVTNTYLSPDGEESVQVFIAVGADGAIRGLWLNAKSPYD
jgi:hypothetical protein